MKTTRLFSLLCTASISLSLASYLSGANAQQKTNDAPAATATVESPQAEPVLQEAPGPGPGPGPQVSFKEVKIGTGTTAVAGKTVSVHYTGWLYDTNAKNFHGKKFDSSRDRAKPISFVLGAHRVIPGWEQGLLGMKVGGRRSLIIPSELAYGARGAGAIIPPDAVLVFDVQLIAVTN